MEIVSAAEMRLIEEEAVKRQGLSLKELMARAGKAVADLAGNLASKGSEIIIYCGRGNNGGDGFVAARHLAGRGYRVKVVSLAESGETTDIAGEALNALTGTSVEIGKLEAEPCLKAGLVIDAVLGFGLKGGVRGSAKAAIEQINRIEGRRLSVDIPSGVDSDTGDVANVAVRADDTLTFTCPKIGLALFPGAEYAGEIHYADIGIWPEIVRHHAAVYLADAEMVGALLPRRPFQTNKHRCGRVLAVAGSVGMTGAAAMTAQAAMRTGAGIVTLATPSSLNDILEVKLTEVMTVPLPETVDRSISSEAVETVLQLAGRFDVVALGPGLSRHEDTAVFVRHLLTQLDMPIVVDADGLNNLAGTDILNRRTAPTVITPHAGELGRLIGKKAEVIETDRLASVKEAAGNLNCTVVLKGSRTVISGQGATMIIPTGNPGMATAGTGDVLTGVIAALMAQGLPAYPGSVAGAYIHGLAGDLAAKAHGQLAMIATDLLDWLPEAIKKVTSDK